MDIFEKRATIRKAKEWVEYNFPSVLEQKNDSYCKTLILTTIDCFAQMWGNYPQKRLKENFCNFVLQYSSQRINLQQVCPVTLYYHHIKEGPIHLHEGRLYNWDDPDLAKEAQRLLLKVEDDTLREIASEKHTYIKLLYQLRNKLVHELNNIGTKIEFSEDVPFIAFGSVIEGETYWTLNYPRLWLYNLAQETIFGFVDDCLKKDRLLRFLDKKRLNDMTWY